VQETLQSRIAELERQPTRMSRLQNLIDHTVNMQKQGFSFEKDCLDFTGNIFNNNAFVLFKKEVAFNDEVFGGKVELEFIKIDIDQMAVYSQPSKVITLEAIFFKDESSVKITNMFTEAKYRRSGHGCYMIEKLKEYSHRQHRPKVIHGDLQESTPIGINNLRRFYEKQGFTVGEKQFKIHLG